METDKENALIKQLASKQFDERKLAMEALAEIASDKAIEALITVVEGKHPRWFRTYSLDDQLTAAKALGNSGAVRAYDYLVKL